MSDDIHDVIARAEQSPGNAVSIDPPEPEDRPDCEHCEEPFEDHVTIRTDGMRNGQFVDIEHRVCPDAWATLEAEGMYAEPEADDEPDPDHARDERIDREFDPPERD